MEEINYKLNTNNTVLIVDAIEKLVNTIHEKYNCKERSKNFIYDNEELKLLQEKCSAKQSVISLTACQGILSLVEYGVLQNAQTMSTMIAILPTVSNYSAILSTMSGLLEQDLKRRLHGFVNSYKCQYTLKSNQHPFIKALECNIDAANSVLAQMSAMCTSQDYILEQNSVELLSPVYLYILCNPTNNVASTELKHKCWQLLLSLRGKGAQLPLIMEVLSWQQLTKPNQIESTLSLYSLYTRTTINKEHHHQTIALVLVLIKLSTHIIHEGLDPRLCYHLVEQCFNISDLMQCTVSLSIVLLAQNVLITPAIYLRSLLTLCEKIISTFEVSKIAIKVLISSILQWLHYPSELTKKSLVIAERILNLPNESTRTFTSELNENCFFKVLKNFDSNIFINFQLLKLWEMFTNDVDKFKLWLNKMLDPSINLCNNVINFMFGILLCESDEVASICLKILLVYVNDNRVTSVSLLPILLYKVDHCQAYKLRVECLKSLPKMAVSKENVPSIVAALNKLKLSKTVAMSLVINLYGTLCEIQGRCYPYLQELLIDLTLCSKNEHRHHVDLARVNAVYTLCKNSGIGSRGAEYASILSTILNRSNEAKCVMTAALALKTVIFLLRARVACPISTWKTLAPRFERDRRPLVHMSICELASEVSSLRVVHSPEYDDVITCCICKLFQIICESESIDVIRTACIALGNYKVDDMMLKHIPEIYRKGISLPPSYCKTPDDAARNPEDVLDYVPAEVWPNVFKYTNQDALDGVKIMCSTFIDKEIKVFRSGVYQTDNEPTNMCYLHANSVLRGLMEFLRKQALHSSYDCPMSAIQAILECLSVEYKRPLPPYDMSFLSELFHRGSMLKYTSIMLATRQAVISGSARALIECYINSIDFTNVQREELINICELLPILCSNIRPSLLRPFIEKLLQYSYNENTHSDEVRLFDVLNLKVGNTLVSSSSKGVPESTRTMLSQIINHFFGVISYKHWGWLSLVEACTNLSEDYIESMTSPTNWWETNSEIVIKSTDIRSRLACKNNSMVWMNDIIDFVITQTNSSLSSNNEYILSSLSKCLFACCKYKETLDWLMQLLARAQAAFNNQSTNIEAIKFLCHLVTMTIVIVSNILYLTTVHNSLSDLCALAPSAMFFLMNKLSEGEQKQILEWFQHSWNLKCIPDEYRYCFYESLLSTRHCKYFAEPSTWTRVVSSRAPYSVDSERQLVIRFDNSDDS